MQKEPNLREPLRVDAESRHEAVYDGRECGGFIRVAAIIQELLGILEFQRFAFKRMLRICSSETPGETSLVYNILNIWRANSV